MAPVLFSFRTGNAVVWEAFESSSTGLQPVALPLELPNRKWYGSVHLAVICRDSGYLVLERKKPAVG